MFSRYCFYDGLVSIIDSGGKFFINYLGQIKDSLGNDISVKNDEEGFLTVHIPSWEGEKDYRVIDLVAIHFKDLRIGKENFSKVIAFHINGDKADVTAKNVGYRFLNGKLELQRFPGFFYVPGFTATAISIKGEAINSKTGNVLKWYKTLPGAKGSIGGYFICSSVGGAGKQAALLRHRAMGLVFLDYTDNCDQLVVNHIDGVPGHDWLSNLEWVTRQDNLIHAYQNNLRNQNQHILVRNVLTGEVKEYYSISEATRALNLPANATILFRLKQSEFSRVCFDGTQVKLKDDPRDWIIPKDPEKAIKDAKLSISVKSRNCKDLSVSEHYSLATAQTATGVNGGTIMYRLNKDDLTPIRGYQFMHLEDDRPWPDFTQEEYLETLDPMNYEITARNHLTGEERSFKSGKRARIELGKNSFMDILKQGRQHLYSDGWQIKYAEDPWEEYTDIEKELYLRTREVMAKHEQTGKIIIAKSSAEMGEVLKLDPKAVKQAALSRGNILYHGYRFRLGISSSPWVNELKINDSPTGQ